MFGILKRNRQWLLRVNMLTMLQGSNINRRMGSRDRQVKDNVDVRGLQHLFYCIYPFNLILLGSFRRLLRQHISKRCHFDDAAILQIVQIGWADVAASDDSDSHACHYSGTPRSVIVVLPSLY
ncbi:hypothetical protein D3C77_488460 [compost metagenome]